MRKIILLLSILTVSAAAAAQTKITGRISDSAGKPVKGVVVSDGYSCVLTDAKGGYALTTNRDAMYVFYSVPSEYQVNSRDGHPDFYTRLEPNVKKYDFSLTRLNGGKEEAFRLFVVADPQAQCPFHVKRFERETVADIKAMVDIQKEPCYGLTLGDLGYTEGKHNATGMLPKMREAMGYDRSHLLFFQTIGNHDNAKAPVEADEHSSTFNIAYQRPFEEVFGPINYSWNRGDVHFVSMKDVDYLLAEKSNKYRAAFTDEQYEWLCQDLSHVPNDKMVIFCVHVAMYERTNPHLEDVRNLLTRFREAHIFAGHTHFMNHKTNSKGIYEHVHAAASGSYWWSCINSDGTPNGYTIYDINGPHIRNWWYKSVGHDLSYQIRMYRGDAAFGGEYEKVQFPYSHDTVLANVFMADKGWKVQLYEDGVLKGDMERIPTTKDAYPEPGSSRDWWAVGYHVGVIGRSHKDLPGKSKMAGGGRKGYLAGCNHMYRRVLENPDAKEIKVVATDTNGNVYEQSVFTQDFDYSENALMNALYTTSRETLDQTY